MTAPIAIYLDGLSVREHRVTLDFQPGVVILQGQETPVIWDAGQIVIEKEFDVKSGRAMFSNRDAPDARLIILSRDVYDMVLPRLKRRHAFIIPLTAQSLTAMCVISVILMAGLYLLIKYESRIFAPRIPQKIQTRFVDIIAKGYETKSNECTVLRNKALSQLANRMASENGIKTVRMLVDPDAEVNAFALPAQTIIVNQGMLKEIKNEDELAGILAHEMGHLRNFHPQQKLISSVGMSILAGLTIGATDMGSLSKFAMMYDDITYTKAMETQADDEALVIMKQSGIDPRGLAALFGRIQKKKGDASNSDRILETYLSTHPATSDRILKFSLKYPARPAPFLKPEEWNALKKDCGVVTPPKKKN